MKRIMCALLSIVTLFIASGCFEAPQAVRDTSDQEKNLWVRYVTRVDKALQARNEAIKTIAEGRNQEQFERNLARADTKFAGPDGKGDVEAVKQWTLAAVEVKEDTSKKIDALIYDLDSKIMEDQELVEAALKLHNAEKEWMDAGADQSAVNSIFDLGADLVGSTKKEK